MDKVLVALIAAALIVGVALTVVIRFAARRHAGLDKEAYTTAWKAIIRSVKNETPDVLQMAVIKADKLVDKAMQEYGVQGATMGERLKARKGRWSHENALWSAHKLRNQIAHEPNVQLSTQTTKRAMMAFEQALKDLGAL